MRILVTGATGFVGRHLVTRLLEAGHEIIAVARRPEGFEAVPWRDRVKAVACDVHAPDVEPILRSKPELLIHLAWPGLPNYQQAFHFEKNLPADCRFLMAVVDSGIPRLMVTGTGAEYGLKGGELREDEATDPVSAYAIAKDSLRRYLQFMQKSRVFVLQWVRLFHLHGAGQSRFSILSQLDAAIDAGAKSFDMSDGAQLRDYLGVEEVARRLTLLAEHPECEGIINCCSGQPISIRQLVEMRMLERGAALKLNLGAYRYPDYEPIAYWGRSGKLDQLFQQLHLDERS